MGTSTGSVVFLEQTSEDYKSSAPLQIPGQARMSPGNLCSDCSKLVESGGEL